MDAGTLFIAFFVFATLALFFGMAYGDYQKTGKWPWTREKKDKVNSGAKFG